MSSRPEIAANANAIRLALAAQAYEAGIVRIVDRDMRGFTHVVASRDGLFVVREDGFRLIAHGLFYGLTLRDDMLYAFECCDLPRAPTRKGRLVRFHLIDGRIAATDVLATGLDNGCHQIDFIGGRMCVVDTYHQSVIRFAVEGGEGERLHPLPYRDADDYAHCNSLIEHDGQILLLLHNGGDGRARPSEVATLDLDWTLIDRRPLPGRDCHNLVVLEDGALMSCGSQAGELIVGDRRIAVSDMMTRGLSVDRERIVVGATALAARADRLGIDGTVTFLDRAYRRRAVLNLPAAPTEIRRIDGADLSLSAGVRTPWAPHPPTG